MYIRTDHKRSIFTRLNHLGTHIEYSRTKKIYVFNCDTCKEEFYRDSHYPPERLSNGYKHFCKKCKHNASYIGINNRINKIVFGSKKIDSSGYVVITLPSSENYPGKKNQSSLYVREHTKVMQDYMGRKLNDGEVVHHIDGDKTNNNLSNLDLCSMQQHNECHAKSEEIIFALYKKGIVKYDKNKKIYYISI